MSLLLGITVLVIWLGLLAMGFWTCSERDDRVLLKIPAEQHQQWPDVVAVIPARDEADVIARALSSVAAQDYPGKFRAILVDDNSQDGTGAIAQALGSTRIEVISGQPLAAGWTGKLWALSQGIAAAGQPKYLWLTDADIEHAPDTLRSLVGMARADDRKLVSFMAQLHCATWPERAIIPAFIYFFMMLYPFNWINRTCWFAGAAGGCVLVERKAFDTAGGIAAIRGALIDDCALGALMKKQGKIWLGLTHRSRSIRPYNSLGEIAAMIARSAYAQLRYSPVMLIGTVIGLGIVFGIAPWLALFTSGAAQWLGLGIVVMMALSFQPVLAFYSRSPLWGLALPVIAVFYTACVLLSAWQHLRGRGGMWKGRAQAMVKS